MPADIIDTERRRLNLTMSAEECLLDDDCPVCVAMYEDFDTPGFWHYDGCNMDDRFEFSFYKTRDEWDEKQREYEQLDREYEEKRMAGHYDFVSDGGEDPF